jgi:DNA-binding MarR family transcriptional regulator
MSEYQENDRMLGAMLRIPFQAIVARIEAGLKARGYTDLRPAHFVIFQQIGSEGARVTELADQAQITKQSMGALVDTVEARGYLERIPDPDDRRAKIVRLTPKGRALERAAREIVAQTEVEWAEKIGKERMEALKQALEALIMVIEAGE